jgi:hypothetical protein
MAPNSTDSFINHWVDIISPLHVCSSTLACLVCAENEAQGWELQYQTTEFALNLVNIGFSPHDAHTHPSWFAWILPTIKTSEFTVLQIVGLDAAVVRTDREVLCTGLTLATAS